MKFNQEYTAIRFPATHHFGYITLRQTAILPVSSRGLMCRL